MDELFQQILALFFPEHCPFCDNIIHPLQDGCESCIQKIQSTASCCPYCGKPLCECKDRKYLDGVYSFAFYEGGVRDGILRMKGEGRASLCRNFSRILSRQIPNRDFDWVTFIPMSPKELRKRGYNPPKLLAQYLAKETKLPFRPLLDKTRETSAQHTLSLEKRKTNLIDAFAVEKPSLVRGKRILLVDDILTSGATLEEGARTLKESGAHSVFAAVIAVTDNRLKPKEKSDIMIENGETDEKTAQ